MAAAGKTAAPGTGMKVTTVRFGRDLWRLLEDEAERAGTSVSQYIREAALARAAAAAGARGESPFELLASAARALSGEAPARHKRELERALEIFERAQSSREGARALRAQSAQASAEARRRAKPDGGRRTRP